MKIGSIIKENIKRVASAIKRVASAIKRVNIGLMVSSIMGLIFNTVIIAIAYVFILIGNFATAIIFIIARIIRPIVSILTKYIPSLHKRLGSKFPINLRRGIYKGVIYSGIKRNPEEILGIALMYSIIIPIVASVSALILGASPIIAILAIIVPFIVVWMALYMLLIILIDRRTSSIEAILPDVLAMISQNIVAGMTPYNALWLAARPEFGPLAFELQSVARSTLAGASLEDSLLAMTRRVKSDKLTRSVKLMIQGMKSGGELPTVLQEIATDMRIEQNLVKKMGAETTAQAMFVLFALLVGAPFLFAASLQFITIFATILGKIDITALLSQQGSGGMISLHPLSITPNFFMTYAIVVLSVSAFFGSLLIGLIRTGKVTSGAPLIPILILLSVAIFMALNYGLSSFFGGMVSI